MNAPRGRTAVVSFPTVSILLEAFLANVTKGLKKPRHHV